MSLFRPGTLAWLVMHEIRLSFRGGKGKRGLIIRGVLVLLYACGGIFAGLALRDKGLEIGADQLRMATAGIVTILSFMIAQVVIGAQRTLYESGDLDLLLSSPIPENRVMEAKTLGLAGSTATTFAFLLFPIVIPFAILAMPRLLAIIPSLGALALIGASLGLGLALVLVRLLGPRGARAFGQILAALLGAMVFLIVQFANQQQGMPAGGRINGFIAWLRENGLGAEGWSATPARAVLGEPLPLLTFLLFALVLFAGTSIAFRRHFLLGYQKAGDRGTARVRARKADGGSRRNLFAGGLLRAIVTKELKLIVRQPEIIFMMALRLIYLAPLVFIGVNAGGSDAIGVPVLAAVGAVAAGQLAGSVSWLTISAEDAPDLLAVSPVATLTLKRLKLVAALIIVAPFALIVPAIIAPGDAAAALIAFIGALAASYVGAAVEMRFGKPQKRSNFTKRQEGSFLVSIVSLFAAMVVGALTAAAIWLI